MSTSSTDKNMYSFIAVYNQFISFYMYMDMDICITIVYNSSDSQNPQKNERNKLQISKIMSNISY